MSWERANENRHLGFVSVPTRFDSDGVVSVQADPYPRQIPRVPNIRRQGY